MWVLFLLFCVSHKRLTDLFAKFYYILKGVLTASGWKLGTTRTHWEGSESWGRHVENQKWGGRLDRNQSRSVPIARSRWAPRRRLALELVRSTSCSTNQPSVDLTRSTACRRGAHGRTFGQSTILLATS